MTLTTLQHLGQAFDAGDDGLPCKTCQGNGEIITDWERYLHPLDGDKGDEAVADCPDCSGTGRVDAEAQ